MAKVVQRFLDASLALSKAFALSVADDETTRVRDEVAFFQTIRTAINKVTRPGGSSTEDVDHAVKQIVARSVNADEVIDLFGAAGLKRPEIGILSDEFLLEVQGLATEKFGRRNAQEAPERRNPRSLEDEPRAVPQVQRDA